MSYPGHSLGESYLSAEMQSVYPTAQADWATGVAVPVSDSNFVSNITVQSLETI